MICSSALMVWTRERFPRIRLRPYCNQEGRALLGWCSNDRRRQSTVTRTRSLRATGRRRPPPGKVSLQTASRRTYTGKRRRRWGRLSRQLRVARGAGAFAVVPAVVTDAAVARTYRVETMTRGRCSRRRRSLHGRSAPQGAGLRRTRRRRRGRFLVLERLRRTVAKDQLQGRRQVARRRRGGCHRRGVLGPLLVAPPPHMALHRPRRIQGMARASLADHRGTRGGRARQITGIGRHLRRWHLTTYQGHRRRPLDTPRNEDRHLLLDAEKLCAWSRMGQEL